MKRWVPLCSLLGALVVVEGCAHRSIAQPMPIANAGNEREVQAILEADRAFARATAKRGLEGWVSYFAEDGAMLPVGGPVTTSPAAIRELMRPVFANPGFRIEWVPAAARVAAANDLGYSIGRFEISVENADRERVVQRRGKYVTIWKKQADGSWKVLLDIGNSDPSEGEQ